MKMLKNGIVSLLGLLGSGGAAWAQCPYLQGSYFCKDQSRLVIKQINSAKGVDYYFTHNGQSWTVLAHNQEYITTEQGVVYSEVAYCKSQHLIYKVLGVDEASGRQVYQEDSDMRLDWDGHFQRTLRRETATGSRSKKEYLEDFCQN